MITTLERSEAIALVDILDGEIINTWPTGGRDSHMVRLAPDDSRAYVAARGSGTLSVIWLNEDRPPTVIPTGARAEGIGVSPAGSEIWIANQSDSNITVVNAESLGITHTLEGIPSNRIEFLPDGWAVVPGGSSADGSVRYVTFFDGASKEIRRRLELPGSTAGGTGIRLLAAHGSLFLADSALDEISVLAPFISNTREPIMMNPDNIDGMAWSPLRVALLLGP